MITQAQLTKLCTSMSPAMQFARSVLQLAANLIGHFRVRSCLCFKTSLIALSETVSLICMKMNLYICFERLFCKRGKAYATMSKVIMGKTISLFSLFNVARLTQIFAFSKKNNAVKKLRSSGY